MNHKAPTTNLVTLERRGAVAVLRYANPPHGDIAAKGAGQLDAALNGLLADDEVRGIVLAGGQPGIFIRHADVGQISRSAEALSEGRADPADFVQGAFPALCRTLDAAQKPVIAALDGVCMGGGFEIALCCTMRVASTAAAAIGLPEIRIHIFPGSGGTQRLRRLIGPHRARLFILRGDVVDAAQALALGLVDEVVPDALQQAVAVAQRLARRPAAAVAAILDLTKDSMPMRLEEEVLRFAALMRDEGEVRARLRQFVAQEEHLNDLE